MRDGIRCNEICGMRWYQMQCNARSERGMSLRLDASRGG